MKKNIQIALLLLLVLMAPLASVQAQQAFSLQQAIDYTMQNQYQLQIAKNQVEISNAKVGEIRAFGLPQINFGADLGNNFVAQKSFLPAEFFGGQPGTFEPVTFTPDYTGFAAFNASQLLFDGSYLIGLKAAGTFTQLTKKAVVQSEIQIVEQVSKAYYGVLVTRERLKLLEQNLIRLDTLLFQTKEMNKQGFAEKLDVDRLQVAYNNLEVDKQRTERLMALSEDLLKFQMGMKQTEKMELTDKLQDVEVDMDKLDTEGFDYKKRIEYSILETQRDLALLDYRYVRSGYLPKLYVNSRFGWNAADNDLGKLGKSANWLNFGYVGLGLQIPIFDGLSKHYKMQQSRLAIDNANLGLKLMEQGIDLELRQSSVNLSNTLLVLESRKANLALAEDIARVAKIKYQEGVGSNLEVITAETDLREAQTNYFASLFDALISKVDLDKATGTLLSK